MAERYELDDRYWEVEPKGRTAFVARWGKIGAASRNQRDYTCADAAAAKAARAKLVAGKLKDGFALAGKKAKAPPVKAPPAKVPANDKLEAILAEDPDDAGAWQVYGDWLQEAGEPWGAVITASAAGKRQGKRQTDANKDILRGLDGSKIQWKHGSIEVLELCPEEDPEKSSDCGKTFDDTPMVRALRRALAHPAGRLVREIILGLPPTGQFKRPWSFDSVIPEIVKAGPLPLLARLDLSRPAQHMDQQSWRAIGDLSGLWAAAPRLRVLLLLGSGGGWSLKGKKQPSVKLGDIDAPYLEMINFESSGLDKGVTRDIARAKLPALQQLVLYFGRRDYGNNHEIGDLATLLAAKGMPKLEYLGIENHEWDVELVTALAKSSLVRRLAERRGVLDLSQGTLASREAAAAFVKHKAKFEKLESLELGDNFFTDDDLARIVKAIPCASGSQREGDDNGTGVMHYYCAVGE